MREKITVYGNPFIGIYARTNENFTLVGRTVSDKFIKYTGRLGTEAMSVTIGDSELVGIYSIANSKGILLSAVASDEELAHIKRIAGSNVNVERLDSKFTAIGNNIATNDHGTLVNPRIPDGDVRKIKDVLDTEAVKFSIGNFETVGSMVLATNNGFISHPGADEEKLKQIESVLKVKGGIGTANGGVPFVPLAVIANTKGFIVGETTTGYELHRISECLGQI